MALTVVATAGAANANSFVTVATVDTYHEGHLYASTWFDATAAKKAQAVVMATGLLEEECRWLGTIASDTQALGLPRVALYDRNGRLLASDEIPAEAEAATAELARLLIDSDRTAPESVELATKRVKAGSIEVEFLNGSTKTDYVIPDAVFNKIRHLCESRLGPITMRRG